MSFLVIPDGMKKRIACAVVDAETVLTQENGSALFFQSFVST